MAIQPASPAEGVVGPHQLFTPGARLGWEFRNRRELMSPFPEPQPDPRDLHDHVATKTARAELAWRWAGRPALGFAMLVGVLVGCSNLAGGGGGLDGGAQTVTLLVLLVPALGIAGWAWFQRSLIRSASAARAHEYAMAAWRERAAAYEEAEQARLAQEPMWGSVAAGPGRTDLFGGSLAGWQALLTVHGASVLAERPLLAVDLTGQQAVGRLTAAVREADVPSAVWLLPADLGRCGLLAELPPKQLADAVAEALHAGEAGGSRADRAIDVRVLGQLASALAERGVTPARLAAAARAAFGHPVPDRVLTAAEQERIAGDLFPPGYREQISASLVRLDAVLSELATYADDNPWRQKAVPARYTCLATEPAARSASGEVITALVIQWLTVQVSSGPGAPAVIIAGADEVARPYLERLAGACEAVGVPLTLLFRHLREDAAAMLGGGAAGFMRLGNHAEAEQAAAFIGRQHTFVLSQFTATDGGSQTGTQTSNEGHGVSDSWSNSRSRTHTSGWNHGRSNQGWFGPQTASRGRNGSNSRGTSWTEGRSSSQNWSEGWSQADGTSWSDAVTRQRVYEYAVEPLVMQNLPECALLLVGNADPVERVRAVECDPVIATLPWVSSVPFVSRLGIEPAPPAGQLLTDARPDMAGDWPEPAYQGETVDQPPDKPWWER